MQRAWPEAEVDYPLNMSSSAAKKSLLGGLPIAPQAKGASRAFACTGFRWAVKTLGIHTLTHDICAANPLTTSINHIKKAGKVPSMVRSAEAWQDKKLK